MEEQDVTLGAWLQAIQSAEMSSWDALPSLELYMDQVITLINREIDLFLTDKDRGITPSMINNYVKAGALPRPEQKKYNREHLATLFLIYMLKAEFSIQEIRDLIGVLSENGETKTLYEEVTRSHAAYLKDSAARIGDVDGMSDAGRCRLAIELAVEANAKRLIATKLLSSVVPHDAEKDKDKKKKKDE